LNSAWWLKEWTHLAFKLKDNVLWFITSFQDTGVWVLVPGDWSLVLLPCLLAGPSVKYLFLDSYGLVLISWPEVKRQVSAAILCSPIKNQADYFFSNKKDSLTPYNLCNSRCQGQPYYYASLTHNVFSKKQT